MMRKLGKALKTAAVWYFTKSAEIYDERTWRYASLSF